MTDFLALRPSGGDLSPSSVVSLLAAYGIRALRGGRVEVTTHPTFGPLLSYSPGGASLEAASLGAASLGAAPDGNLRVLPLTASEAAELISSTPGAPADQAPLVDLVLRLSQLVHDTPEVTSISVQGAASVTVAPYHPMPELALRRLL